MKKNNNPANQFLSQKDPWENSTNSIWLGSTISLYRNIQKFKFPNKLENERQKQIISLISQGIAESGLVKDSFIIRADELTPFHRQLIAEHFLSQESYQQAHSGEAFVMENSGEFLTTINVHDHIRFQIIDCQGELESTWNRLVSLETFLGKKIQYAFSQKYGFLTSDFNQCGTGLVVAVFLQLPALVHTNTIDDALEKCADDTVLVTGIQGNPTEIIGDILMVQNSYTLGLTEENIISIIRSFTTKMIMEENAMRRKIVQENNAEVMDRVSRSFGILLHSYQIEAIEALNAISLLKLGVELGWVVGINLQEINHLFFKCRRAHLIKQFGESIKMEEIPHKRAEFIHKYLKKITLTI